MKKRKIVKDYLSVKDYLRSEKIWDTVEMKYMGDYHDNYF